MGKPLRNSTSSKEMSTTLDVWSYRVFGTHCFSLRVPESAELIPLAWGPVPSTSALDLVWSELASATAEGLVLMSLAVAGTNAERLRLVGLPETLQTSIANPLSVSNLAVRATLHELAPGAFVLPPHRIQLQNDSDCEANARLYAERLISLASRGREDERLRESIELTLLEVLTNAYEHGARGYAIISASLGRADRWRVEHMPEPERQWLQNHPTKRVLEFTVGDLGPGVPAHLEQNYVAAVASLIRRRRRNGLPRPAADESWHAHTAICRWAFEHYSTSKEDVRTPTASLNWRGLHRALAYNAWHDGFVALTSGYARTGFATYGDTTHPFECRRVADAPVPGTLVTIRHILHAIDGRSSRVFVPSFSHKGSQSGYTAAQSSSIVPEETSSERTSLAVVHPFVQGWLHGDRRGGDVEALRMAEPRRVSMHYFTDVTPERLAGLMAETTDNAWSRAIGSPRLVGAWTPTDGVMWAIAGAVPKGSLKWFSALVRDGSHHTPQDSTASITVNELARQYPEYLTIAQDKVFLKWPDEHTAHDLRRYASEVLHKYSRLQNAIYDSVPPERVLLTDNTKVQRYFSLTALVEDNDVLCAVLSHLLIAELTRLSQRHGPLVVVTATLASYYLARRLLRVANRSDVDVHFLGSHATRQTTAVLFQTATRSGRSLRDAALRAATSPVAAIVGVDLGDGGEANNADEIIPVHSLLAFPFNPREIHDDGDEKMRAVSRVICTVSDWPVRIEDPPSLTASAHAERIIRDVPEMFSAGLQVINARVHSVALPGAALVERRPDLVEDWFASVIAAELMRVEARHVTMISRRESPLYGRLPHIAARLFARGDVRISADRIALPSVQFSGHSAIFANPGVLTPRRETLHPQGTLMPPDAPVRYCVVYLDTAAVTGKNIRAGINMLPALSPSPVSFCVFVLTDRLSPRDRRFLNTVALRDTHNADAVISFKFDHLFRLQVGSHEHLDTTAAARLIEELDARDVREYEHTAPYLATLRARMNELAHAMATNASRSRAFGHFFTPDDDTAIRLTADAILFRHTLALFHQNEPVMTTLRTSLHHLVDGRDTGLLAILAVEPNLMRQPPLLLDGWADVRAMASTCLDDGSASTATLSDAMAVLCLDTATAVASFRALAAGVERRPTLMPQLLTFLARLVRNEEHAGEQFLRALAELSEPSQPLAAVLAPFLKARMQAHWPGSVRLEGDALGAVYDFVKTMFPHSPAHNAWRDADLLFTLNEPPAQIPARQVTLEAIAVARNTLLPALRAVRRLARDRDDLAAVNALEEAQIDILQAIEELHQIVANESIKDIAEVRDARKAWATLRDGLVVRDPFRFLGSTDGPAHQPLLESAMKKYFAMPELIVAAYSASHGVIDVNLNGRRWPDGYRSLVPREGGAWIAPIGYQAVIDITRLAIENHKRHGVRGTLRIGIRAQDAARESGTTLTVVFTDIASTSPSSAGGYGIEVIKSICRRWSLPEPQPRRSDEIYVLPIQFTRCAYVAWDQELSDAVLHN